MNTKFEYYKIGGSGGGDIPLLALMPKSPRYLYKSKYIENPVMMYYGFGDPVPLRPRLVDYHSAPHSIVSEKIYNVLEKMEIYGLQLLPTTIVSREGEEYSGYYALHIHNYIKCVDKELSDCKFITNGILDAKKIVLDKKILESKPLEERLIFRLDEASGYKLFHISIMEKIMAVDPEGIRFVNIEEWTDAAYFD